MTPQEFKDGFRVLFFLALMVNAAIGTIALWAWLLSPGTGS